VPQSYQYSYPLLQQYSALQVSCRCIFCERYIRVRDHVSEPPAEMAVGQQVVSVKSTRLSVGVLGVLLYRGVPPFGPTQPVGLIYPVYLHLCMPCINKSYLKTYKLLACNATKRLDENYDLGVVNDEATQVHAVLCGRCLVMGEMNADFCSLASTSFLPYVHAVFSVFIHILKVLVKKLRGC
jgi:hypothetical protein